MIQRVSEKVKSSQLKKAVTNNMKHCMYSVDRQLRDPEDMEKRLEHLRKKVSSGNLACSEAEWNSCI